MDDLIDQAIEFDMTAIVECYAVDRDIPLTLAKRHEFELKRYLTLRALLPHETLAMAGPVDELWHDFILATADYRRFCEQVGGTFIDHRPARLDGLSRDTDGYARTLRAYRETFVEDPDPMYWPPVDVLVAAGLGEDCGRCT